MRVEAIESLPLEGPRAGRSCGVVSGARQLLSRRSSRRGSPLADSWIVWGQIALLTAKACMAELIRASGISYQLQTLTCPPPMRIFPSETPNAGSRTMATDLPHAAELLQAFTAFASFGVSSPQDTMDSRNFTKLCRVRDTSVCQPKGKTWCDSKSNRLSWTGDEAPWQEAHGHRYG
jgi:hypothetical protein